MKNLAVFALLLGSGAVPVLADTQFNFTYTDAQYTLSGILTASPNGGGIYTATGVSGTIFQNSDPTTTYALTLVPPGAVPSNHNGDNVYGQDDLLYLNQPLQLLTVNPSYFGNGGIEFAFPAPPPLSGYNGGSDIALYANGSGDYGSYESANLGGYGNTVATGGIFTLTAVPEPDALILLLTMMAGVVGLVHLLKLKHRA